MLLFSTACQTSPKTKPLAELTEEQQLALYKYSPVTVPKDKGYDWDNIYRDTALVIMLIPLIIVESLAQSGAQFSAGK